MLRQQSEPEEKSEQVATLLRKWDAYPGSRKVAERELRALGPSAIPELARLIQGESLRRKSVMRRIFGVVGLFSIVGTCLALFLTLRGFFGSSAAYAPFAIFGIALAGMLLGLLAGLRGDLNANLQNRALDALMVLDDPRGIGPLIEAAAWANDHTRSALTAALLRLLPRLEPEHASLLSEEQQKILRHWLSPGHAEAEPELTLSALAALAQIGDREDAARLACLIVMDAPTSRLQRVRAAAHEALPLLLHRLDYGGIEEIGPHAHKLHRLHFWQGNNTAFDMAKLLDCKLALMRLLPLLQRENAAHLSVAAREDLYRALSIDESLYQICTLFRLGPEFQLQAIAALERIEDTHALPTLRRIAGRDAPTEAEQAIRAAARAACKTLEPLAEREKAGDTLLRASAAPEAASDTLLRPVEGVVATDPQELLRPGPSAPPSP